MFVARVGSVGLHIVNSISIVGKEKKEKEKTYLGLKTCRVSSPCSIAYVNFQALSLIPCLCWRWCGSHLLDPSPSGVDHVVVEV
jgi:hypothetical protein